jgi:hypothetical protein
MNRAIRKRTAIFLGCVFLFGGRREATAQSPTFDERAAAIERKLEELTRDIRGLREAAGKTEAPTTKVAGASEADLAKIRDEGLNR